MDEHQKAAYVVLRDTAEKLRALVVGSLSQDHPLNLPINVTDSIIIAVNQLHSAQRILEH